MVDKNPSADAGDTSVIPGQGRPHTPQSTQARAPQLLSLCSRAWEPHLLKPAHPRACALQQGKPTQWEACSTAARVQPVLTATRERPARQQRPNTAKNKQNYVKNIVNAKFKNILLPSSWSHASPLAILQFTTRGQAKTDFLWESHISG